MALTKNCIFSAAALLSLSACVEEDASTAMVATPSVGSANDLSDFRGARAGQAEMGLRSLGYEPVRSQGLTTYWFNRASGACAEIVTSEGRYSSVTMLPAEDC